MDDLFIFLGLLLLFIGVPALVLILIVKLVKRKQIKKILISIPCCIAFSFIFIIIGAEISLDSKDKEKSVIEKQKATNVESTETSDISETQEEVPQEYIESTIVPTESPTATPKPKMNPIPKPTKKTQKEKLTKAQYKKQCKILYHDDVFFTKESLKGKFVKLRLFIGEDKFFKTNLDSATQDFIKKNDIQRDFYECLVKRKGETSYTSKGTVMIYLPKKFNSSKYGAGDYITVYGKVAEFSTNTWTGYNSVSVVAKYVEKGER